MAYEKTIWTNGATALSAENMNHIENGIAALDEGKVDKETGKGLSANDYTTAEKTKLAGIETGAEVNQYAFSNVKVGSTTIAADSKKDTLVLSAGSNVTLTPDATNDKVTIAATNTTYSAATTSTNGLMSASDKTKLDGIAAGAQVNPGNATTSAAGLMSASDKTKLDGIAAGAQVNRSIAVVGHTLPSNVTVYANDYSTFDFSGSTSAYSYRAISGIRLWDTSQSAASVCIMDVLTYSNGVRLRVYNPTDSSITISKNDSYVNVLCISA